MLAWYVAKSKPQKERFLMAYLARWDVETFFPEIIRPAPGTGRLEPLFPTYLFCRLDPAASTWPAVRWASGLSYFLSADGQPVSVPGSLIEYLRDRVQQWNDGSFRRQFTAGDSVTIVGGPFAGLEGIFKGYVRARQRCQVLLQVVGRLTLVELPDWDLGTVAAGPGKGAVPVLS